MKRVLFIVFAAILFCGIIYADQRLEEGRKLARDGKNEQAKEWFESFLDKNEENAEAWYFLGQVYLQLKDHDEALDCFDEAIDLDENNAEYYFRRGQALGIKIQNSMALKKAWLAPKVLSAFEKTIELDSTHLGGHIGAASYYLQAPAIMGGDIDKAREQAEILMGLDEVQGRMIWASIYQNEENYEMAEKEYDKISSAYIDSTGNYSFYNNYGYFLLNQKKYEKAVEIFKKQVSLAPDMANSYDSLGDGYKAWGKNDMAITQYRKALEVDPDFEASQNNIEELEELKKE